MAGSWEVTLEADNSGKPFQVWRNGQYELSQNVNLGLEGGWVFELELAGKRVALCPSLREGKEAASRHIEELACAAEGSVGSDGEAKAS